MGFFRKKKEPIVHPQVERCIYVRGARESVEQRFTQFDKIMGSHARELSLRVETAGDWMRLQPPADGVHPWEMLNLACFLQDLGPLLLTSDASPTFPAHWLVPTTNASDLFEGYTANEEAISIEVPSNRVVRDDSDVGQLAQSIRDALTAFGVPASGWVSASALVVRSEDPQHDLGPTLEDSAESRRSLSFVSWTGGTV